MKPKNSTKDIETKSPKKENRRSKAKYPALQKKFNLKMRQDYIETEYVNGVYDKDGRMLMRPMNNDEKNFLNSFYEEVIGANFMHDNELRRLHGEMKILKDRKYLSEEENLKLMELQIEYFARADDVLLYSDHCDQKKLYGENNARNRCVYNRSKSINMLDELNDSTYDDIHERIYNDPTIADKLLIKQLDAKKKSKT